MKLAIRTAILIAELLATALSVSACELEIMHGVPIYGSDLACSAPADFTDATPETTVVIPAGATVTLSEPATVLDVLVRGELIVQSRLTVRTLTASGGIMRLTDGGEIVIRDLPFAEYDSGQWGVGVLAIGGGQILADTEDWRQGVATLAGNIDAGMSLFQVDGKPQGWREGDTIVLHDTRQPVDGSVLSAQTELVTVQSVSDDGIVYLTAPVQFSHAGDYDVMPKVGCLSQPLTIRSENPDGTRGHVAAIGDGAMYLAGVQLQGMGRTTTEPLSADNVVGRYVTHWHHAYGLPDETREWQGWLRHVSVWDGPKWGTSVHNSYFVDVSDCVYYDCAGCGIVTEQVLSYGFRIADNFVCAKSAGSGQRITDRSSRNDSSATADHWHDRVGLGLGSAMGEITGNYLACCKDSIGMTGFRTTTLYGPAKRGVKLSGRSDPNTTPDLHVILIDGVRTFRYPFLFDTSNNTAWGGYRGIETWTADCYPDMEKMFPGLTIVHCFRGTDIEDHRETTTYNWRLLGDFTQAVAPVGNATNTTIGLDFKNSYEFGQSHFGMEIRGYGVAYESVFPDEYVTFHDCTFECPVVVYQPLGQRTHNCVMSFADCEFLPVNGGVTFIDGWYPKNSTYAGGINRADHKYLVPVSFHLRPWHDGRDLDVYHPMQHPSWQDGRGEPQPGTSYGDLPVGVWTQQQLIDLGTPIFGAAVPDDAEPFGKWFFAHDVTQPELTLSEQIDALDASDELKAILHELNNRCGE